MSFSQLVAFSNLVDLDSRVSQFRPLPKLRRPRHRSRLFHNPLSEGRLLTTTTTNNMDSATAQSRIDVGSLEAIFTDSPGRVQVPTVQCVAVKPMQTSTGENAERWRIVFSDTKHYVQSMLATNLNVEISEGRLQKGAIVQLLQYTANSVKSKRYGELVPLIGIRLTSLEY